MTPGTNDKRREDPIHERKEHQIPDHPLDPLLGRRPEVHLCREEQQRTDHRRGAARERHEAPEENPQTQLRIGMPSSPRSSVCTSSSSSPSEKASSSRFSSEKRFTFGSESRPTHSSFCSYLKAWRLPERTTTSSRKKRSSTS